MVGFQPKQAVWTIKIAQSTMATPMSHINTAHYHLHCYLTVVVFDITIIEILTAWAAVLTSRNIV